MKDGKLLQLNYTLQYKSDFHYSTILVCLATSWHLMGDNETFAIHCGIKFANGLLEWLTYKT